MTADHAICFLPPYPLPPSVSLRLGPAGATLLCPPPGPGQWPTVQLQEPAAVSLTPSRLGRFGLDDGCRAVSSKLLRGCAEVGTSLSPLFRYVCLCGPLLTTSSQQLHFLRYAYCDNWNQHYLIIIIWRCNSQNYLRIQWVYTKNDVITHLTLCTNYFPNYMISHLVYNMSCQ